MFQVVMFFPFFFFAALSQDVTAKIDDKIFDDKIFNGKIFDDKNIQAMIAEPIISALKNLDKNNNYKVVSTTFMKCTFIPGQPLKCENGKPGEVKCPDLDDSGGLFNIQYSNGLEVGSTAFYTCRDTTKKFSGMNMRVCFPAGQWSSMSAACSDVTCPMFQNENNLNVSYSNSNKMNSVATFSCSSNARLVGAIHSFCQHDGSWSVSSPLCEDITCPMLQNENNLDVSYSNGNKMNSVATFSCRNNAKVVGAITSTCQQDGSWSVPSPHCEDITCPMIQNEHILDISYSNGNKMNSVATFSCPSYSKIVGTINSTCQQDGSWSVPPSNCGEHPADEIRCPVLDDDQEFIIVYDNDRRVNSTARYTCKNNTKELQGTGIRTCLRIGEWSESAPSCGGPANCSTFPHSRSVQISYSKGVSANSIATFRCAPDHVLIGKSYSICERNGAWSNPLPSCLGAVSGCVLERDPFSTLRIEPVKETYRFAEFIDLSCPLRRELSPAVNRIMCLGTKWSDSLPKCV